MYAASWMTHHLGKLGGIQGFRCNLHDGLGLKLEGLENMDILVIQLSHNCRSLGDGGIEALQQDPVACRQN